jgi:DNA-binding transcriptional LysR family regulator
MLERIVGAQLVVRVPGRHAVGLTDAGRILLRHLSGIEAQLASARAEIEAYGRGEAGTIRVGAFESAAARIVPRLMARLRELLPEVRVVLEEARYDLALLRSLERKIVDLAFAVLPLPPGPFRGRPVLDDPWVLVAAAASRFTEREYTTLSEVARLPLASFRAPRSIEDLLGRFHAAGLEPNIVFQSDYNVVLQRFAGEGLGVALMPELAVDPADPRVAVLPGPRDIPPRRIAIAWSADAELSEAAKTFISLATEPSGERDADRAGGGSDAASPPLATRVAELHRRVA